MRKTDSCVPLFGLFVSKVGVSPLTCGVSGAEKKFANEFVTALVLQGRLGAHCKPKLTVHKSRAGHATSYNGSGSE
jgi:hypothetical protein